MRLLGVGSSLFLLLGMSLLGLCVCAYRLSLMMSCGVFGQEREQDVLPCCQVPGRDFVASFA